jgi:hypothetical protein
MKPQPQPEHEDPEHMARLHQLMDPETSQFHGYAGTIGAQIAVWIDQNPVGSKKPSESDSDDDLHRWVGKAICSRCFEARAANGACNCG